jgi:hypothetical protein
MLALRDTASENAALNTSDARLLNTPQSDGRARRPARWALGLAALLAIGGCSSVSWPWNRHPDTTAVAPAAPGTDNTADCDRLRSEIKDNEERRRNAPADSTSPEIVAAAEAKAGQQLDTLRARFDALDCPGESDPRFRRAPVTPAPGALPP